MHTYIHIKVNMLHDGGIRIQTNSHGRQRDHLQAISFCFSPNICFGCPFLAAVTVLVVIDGLPISGPPWANGRYIFTNIENPYIIPETIVRKLSLISISEKHFEHLDF